MTLLETHTVRNISRNTTSTSCPVKARDSNSCPISFPCVHGYCQHSPSTENGTEVVECVCDPGWIDHRCDTCCQSQCLHGVCALRHLRPGVADDYGNRSVSNGTECLCQWGYQGEFCDSETRVSATREGTHFITCL